MHYSIGAGVIGQRPELASLVGQCIAMWTDIELQMALSLGAFHFHHQPREPKQPVNYLGQMLSLHLIKQALQTVRQKSGVT
jgi:hypothetical protein